METFSNREQIVQTINKLFTYTDFQEWDKLSNEVFDEHVQLDMTSLGGNNEKMTPKQITDMWSAGFKDLDAVHHLGGNYIIDINGNQATVLAYANATHYKAAATKGTTRSFIGSYDLGLVKTPAGWRIKDFKYNLKYMTGNIDLV